MKSYADARASLPCRAGVAMILIQSIVATAAFSQSPATLPAEGPASRARDPLATKQQIVRDRMTQLEDRMFRLTEKLSKTEPQQARKLEAAIRRSQELLIRRNMDDAVELLEEGKLTDAGERQVAVVKGLEGVLRILLEEGDNSKQRQEELDRLRAYRDRVQRLLDQERKLKSQSDAAPRLARMLAGIQAAIARLEALAGRQEKEIAGVSQAAQSGDSSDAGRFSESQKTIREETQEVGESLEDPAGSTNQPEGAGRTDDASESAPPAGDASSPSQPGTDAPRQAGHSAKPSLEPPGGEGQPAGKPKQDAQSSPRQSNEDEQDRSPRDEAAIEAGLRKAREDVNQAAGQMRSAEAELGKPALPEALPMQKKALESLRRALRELKTQEEEVRRQLDQAQAARIQRELQKQAGKLAEQMKSGQSGDQQPGGQDGGQQGGRQGGQQQGGQQQPGQQQPGQQQGGQRQDTPESDRPRPPTPGNQNVERAGQHMERAAEELEKDKPEDASPEQQNAVEQLEQAQRELEQALDQLRREQQEEILRGLESRFRAMLAQQTIINEGTLGLDQKGHQAWDRADELRLAGLAQDQDSVAQQAGQALNILMEEGTTLVFPRIVEQMREDMGLVAAHLRDKKTGARTQRIQADIVTTLKQLIEAVQEMRRKVQSGESGGESGQSRPPPLLPSSAELKLLRACQERVNRQTNDFHVEYGQAERQQADTRRELEQIAHRQQEVAEMARKLNERITGQ